MIHIDIDMSDEKISYSKKYYNTNREKILAYQKEYYRNKKSSQFTGKIKVKRGKFILFDPKKPCVINWDSDNE